VGVADVELDRPERWASSGWEYKGAKRQTATSAQDAGKSRHSSGLPRQLRLDTGGTPVTIKKNEKKRRGSRVRRRSPHTWANPECSFKRDHNHSHHTSHFASRNGGIVPEKKPRTRGKKRPLKALWRPTSNTHGRLNIVKNADGGG